MSIFLCKALVFFVRLCYNPFMMINFFETGESALNFEFAAITNRGKIRAENQDTLFLRDTVVNEDDFEVFAAGDTAQTSFFAVFDGMGGEECGKEASLLAANTLLQLPLSAPWDTLCGAMNERICAFMRENEIRAMGSTAAMVRLCGEEGEYCNIGDSRVYLIDTLDMYRLSKDHTTTAFAGRRALTQHLGIEPKEILIEPHFGTFPLKKGSTLLLCSDGLTDLLTEPEIGKHIIMNTAADAAKALCETALQRGGKDNLSIILIHLS